MMYSIECQFGRFKGVIRTPSHSDCLADILAFATRETENIKIGRIGIAPIPALTQGDR